MLKYHGLMIVALSLGLWLQAFQRITWQHALRQKWAQIQAVEQEYHALHEGWTQHLLEWGTWTSPDRLHYLARDHFKMAYPTQKNSEVWCDMYKDEYVSR